MCLPEQDVEWNKNMPLQQQVVWATCGPKTLPMLILKPIFCRNQKSAKWMLRNTTQFMRHVSGFWWHKFNCGTFTTRCSGHSWILLHWKEEIDNYFLRNLNGRRRKWRMCICMYSLDPICHFFLRNSLTVVGKKRCGYPVCEPIVHHHHQHCICFQRVIGKSNQKYFHRNWGLQWI